MTPLLFLKERRMRARIVITAAMLVGSACTIASAEDVPTVQLALAATRDVWGEMAIRQPNGPSYEFFEKLLPPLRYVNCQFKNYPIALSAPLGATKARLISNGSGINLPTGTDGKIWYDYPIGAQIEIADEQFGKDLARLKGPTYERGYLPIVRMEYQTPAGAVTEEAFVPVKGPLAEHGAVIVRLSASENQSIPIALNISTNGKVNAHNNAWMDANNNALLWISAGWTSNTPDKRLTGTLKPGSPLIFAVFSKPLESPALADLDEPTYQNLRSACAAEWESWIARTMQLQVPEERVNRAWKTTIIADLMMASGDQMNYSAGNVYQRLYEAESGDAISSLMQYGFTDLAEKMMAPMLHYEQRGLAFHDAAFKLQLLAHIYWITHDAAFIQAHHDLWRPAVDVILKHREKDSGLLPKENYCADIGTQVYSLNSNANSWRGLRDIAAVLRDMGQTKEADEIAIPASEFRTAILAALDKSERRDVTPAFIPIALFGAEQPYDRLMDSKLGGYWDLMIPYVLGSGILNDTRTQAAIDYLQTHGGVCMGMIRFDQHSGLFANEKGLDDLYGLRYTQALLKRDQVESALVSFYGKLAQGMTRDTFIDGEGSSLVALDPAGRPMYLPPNSSGNALFLTTLRELLVQDQDEDGDGTPDTLRLMFATPRQWMADGKTVRLENAPTAFGPVSISARSELSKGRVTVEITPPARQAKRMQLRMRLPAGWKVTGADIDGDALKIDDRATVDLPAGQKKTTIHFTAAAE
ncbi:MAG TPA: hypothetical protein VFE58_07770 [Tepidisphaeraceae bacterium]|jgi:hypothetical protein|nr:hypothetical protein [Tepidisphaeraceae bacterium]